MPFANQFVRNFNAQIHAQINPKSFPYDAPKQPKSSRKRPRSTPNRFKIASGILLGRPLVPKSVLTATRGRLGSVSGRPRRAPGAPGRAPRVPRDAKKDAQERPGAPQGDQNRRQLAPGSENIDFFRAARSQSVVGAMFRRFFLIFVFRKVCGPSEVLRLPAKTEVRPFALRVDSLAQFYLGKRRTSTPKSTQNRR